MQLNEAGRVLKGVWDGLPERFPSVALDRSVVMPNHMHGLMFFVGAGLAPPKGEGAASSAPTLGDVVRALKPISAVHVNRLLGRTGHPLWQRNYYDHIVRNEDDLDRIRQYISENPARWDMDPENPARREPDEGEGWRARR